MNEIFVILNKGTVYQNLYFLRLGEARNYIMFSEPKSNWKEIEFNCFINSFTGKKMQIITLELKGDLEKQLRDGMEKEMNSYPKVIVSESYRRKIILSQIQDELDFNKEHFQTPQPKNKGYRVVQNMFFSPVKPTVEGGENLTKQEALDLAKKLNYADDDVYVSYEALDLQDKVVYND